MTTKLLMVFHLGACFLIIALVLLQHGKGADAGASFGGGGANSVFGAAGTSNFLSKTTRWAVIVFFATSLSFMIFFSKESKSSSSVLDQPIQSEVPVISQPVKTDSSQIPTAPTPVPQK